MNQNQKEIQVIEVSSKITNASQPQKETYKGRPSQPAGKQRTAVTLRSGKKKNRSGLRTFLRVLFLSAAIIILAYVSVVGIFLYRQNHPEKVDFATLKNNRIASLTGISVEDVGLEEELQKLAERNPETADYVENYGNREDYIGKDIDLSEDVEEGVVPLLMQWDKRWGYESFGDSNIGLAGCGPVCFSMAYLYFTGDLGGNPREIAGYCETNGFYSSAGTSWDFWTLGAAQFGLDGQELPLDENRMKLSLDDGSLIVCSMRPGDFTETGHYILLRGYDENGFFVNDPNRRSNSEKQWTYDVLKGQIRNLWTLNLMNDQ